MLKITPPTPRAIVEDEHAKPGGPYFDEVPATLTVEGDYSVIRSSSKHYRQTTRVPLDDPEELAFRWGPVERTPNLPPVFGVSDLNPLPRWYGVTSRDEIRIPVLLDSLVEECSTEHATFVHAFCPTCRKDRSPAEMAQRLVGASEEDREGLLLSLRSGEATLRRYLALNPGADLPVVPADYGIDGHDGGLDIYKPSALHALPKAEPLVEIGGSMVIPARSVGYISGFDGVWKTFASLGFAAGLAMMGKRVLYIMGEGVFATDDRLQAICQHRGWDIADLDAGLDIKGSTVNLFDAGADFAALLELAGRERYDLVVVDTLARSVGAGNQDSATDMSVVTHHVDQIKQASGGSVLIVAHTGKDADKGIRGSSALRANADFAIAMKRDGDTVRLSTKAEHGGKMKDAPQDYEVRLAPLQVGPSMVLVDASTIEPTEPSEGSHTDRNRVLVALATAYAQGFVSQAHVRRLTEGDGSDKPIINDGSVSRTVATLLREGIIEKHASKKEYRLVESDETARRYLGRIA